MNILCKTIWSATLIFVLTPGVLRAVDVAPLSARLPFRNAPHATHPDLPDDAQPNYSAPDDGKSDDASEEEGELNRFSWKFKGAGWLASNVESNDSYDGASRGAIAGDLKLYWLLSDPRDRQAHGSDLLGVTVEAGQGEGLDGVVPTFGVFLDELQTDRAVRLTKAWYEHVSRFGWRARFGLLDLTLDRFDENQFANAGYTQFSSSAFVNNRAWDQPGSAPGASIWKELGEHVAVGVGYQSVTKWDDVFSHGSAIAQLEYRTASEDAPGTYRFYGWVNDAKKYEKTNAGWGFSLDQQVLPALGLWARCGFQNEDVADIASHLSAGVELKNPSGYQRYDSPNALGFGVAVINASSAYKKRVDASARDELWIESYYRFYVSDYAHFSPYVQYVRSPMGLRANGDVFVLGLRCGVSL